MCTASVVVLPVIQTHQLSSIKGTSGGKNLNQVCHSTEPCIHEWSWRVLKKCVRQGGCMYVYSPKTNKKLPTYKCCFFSDDQRSKVVSIRWLLSNGTNTQALPSAQLLFQSNALASIWPNLALLCQILLWGEYKVMFSFFLKGEIRKQEQKRTNKSNRKHLPYTPIKSVSHRACVMQPTDRSD